MPPGWSRDLFFSIQLRNFLHILRENPAGRLSHFWGCPLPFSCIFLRGPGQGTCSAFFNPSLLAGAFFYELSLGLRGRFRAQNSASFKPSLLAGSFFYKFSPGLRGRSKVLAVAFLKPRYWLVFSSMNSAQG